MTVSHCSDCIRRSGVLTPRSELSSDAPASAATLVESHTELRNINRPQANATKLAPYNHPYTMRRGPAPSASRPASPAAVQEDFEVAYHFNDATGEMEAHLVDRGVSANRNGEETSSPKGKMSKAVKWRVVG